MTTDIFDVTRIAKPLERPLKVYAFDPSAGYLVGNRMTALVRYEALQPGPVSERFAVVDYDGSRKTYYEPVNLDDPRITIRGGLDPAEADPRFHQQMVYAVASETLQRFENALGRRVHWARFKRPAGTGKEPKGGGNAHPDPAARDLLFLFPHAMAEANAFYSRDAQGILFGYFRASRTSPGANLPGQAVFSCLSHDIIAHETTHAIVDGIRGFFTEPTNIDVAAFHEAFADISALFCHFAHGDALLDTLQKTGGGLFRSRGLRAHSDSPLIQLDLPQANPLIQLAWQFGQASGMRAGLRSALGTPPNSDDIKTKTEPHDRGAILVAAIFDAYFTIYTRRTADLFRIYHAGGGERGSDLPQSLAERLAAEASGTAEEFFNICARALDYCPPVDIVFGDFLRAVLTAHMDLHPADPDGVRNAFMEAFRLRGILPEGADFYSESAICWPQVAPGKLPPVKGLLFGDPNGLTDAEKDINGDVLRAYARDNAQTLGFPPDHGPIQVPSFHPMFRIGPHGDLIVDMVVELVETVKLKDPDLGTIPFRSGVTLLIWQEKLSGGERPDPQIHYVIPKHRSAEREHRQLTYYANADALRGGHDHHGEGTHAQDDGKSGDARWQIDFALIHAGL